MALRCGAFQSIRETGQIAQKRQMYRELRQETRFSDLPELPGNASSERIEQALQEWENTHPEALSRARDNGQFFGFKEVGQAKLERFTRFVFVPAVRDAAQDAIEGRGKVFSELMDIVVRNTFDQKKEIQELRQEVSEKYKQIFAPEGGLEELIQLESELKNTLGLFAPGTGLYINWDSDQSIDINLPKGSVDLEEDGFRTGVARVGHGLQRAFILTVLQHLTLRQAKVGTSSDSTMEAQGVDGSISDVKPSLILGVEEVELYQHPTRQRHLAKILLELSQNPPSGLQNIQIIYTTHSPLFIDLERFDQIRLCRKEPSDKGMPKVTTISCSSLESIVREKELIDCRPEGSYSLEGERARLKTLMTPWTNEGFFADVVVLVEGEEDRAAIIGACKLKGLHLESQDIAIIPCNGKANIPKAALTFKAFKIPTYVIWDGDKDKKDKKDAHPEINRALLRLHEGTETGFPDTIIEQNYACFENSLTDTLRAEIGEQLYRELMDKLKENYGFQEDNQARKNPAVVEELLYLASKQGKECKTLRDIVQKIEDLI